MLLILLTTILVLILIHWWTSKPLLWRGQGIAWTIPWPIFGSTIGTFTSTFYDFWCGFYFKYEGHSLVGLHLFSNPALLVRDPEKIKELLVKKGQHFLDRGLSYNDKDPFRTNLLYVNGEDFRTLRANITQYLSPSRIKAMFPIIESSLESFCRILDLHLKKGPVDMDEMCLILISDVTNSTIFGVQSDVLTNPDSLILKLQKELIGPSFGLRILVGCLSPTLYRILGLTTLPKSITVAVMDFVQRVLDLRTKGIGVRPDFMQGMVELFEKNKNLPKEDQFYSDGTKVPRFNTEGVASQCMIMFSASTETLGRNLGFLFYELALNQNIQERLREEILNTKDKHNGKIGYDEVNDMKYLEMVIFESLRKYPPVVITGRRATTTIHTDNVIIEKGTLIIMIIGGFLSDPKYYPNPEKFDPERFVSEEAKHLGSYLPFGIGPRSCAGMKMAHVTMKLVVSKMMLKYKFEPCSSTPKKMKYHNGPTLRPAVPLNINIIPI